MKQEKTCDIKRQLPEWAQVVKEVNGLPIYNMNIFDNIMSWNQGHKDISAFDYYGFQITYGELPKRVDEYISGLLAMGISTNEVVTLCLPVSIENMMFLLALNRMGTISNNVNFLFLKSDFRFYTAEKKSSTLVILDAYLPFVVDYLEESGIKNVIVTSLKYYLPDDKKNLFDDYSLLPPKMREIFDNPSKQAECMMKVAKLEDIRVVTLDDVLSEGKKHRVMVKSTPVDMDRDISYSYTSGTTGRPKCIVYKEASANAFVEMHAGIDTKDYVGERVFQVIPLTHATGERVSGYLQMAKGKTLVPQPIYNKDTFGVDLMNSKCNWVVAAPSFYLAGVAKGLIAPNALAHITRPSSGGEPVTKSNVELIDKWLAMNGCNVRFAIGGGAAEDGSGTIFTYFMDEKMKTNETGYPLEPYIMAKIVDDNGVSVSKGHRGYLHISSPAAADRYLYDKTATMERWYVDSEGIRWGITGDIAVQNADNSYNILGRATDSYVDKDGKKVYLFDIEYALESSDPIIEWEITALTIKEGTALVAQIVLKPEYVDQKAFVVELLCQKYNLDAVKIYNSFPISDITGKRDFKVLKSDMTGYLAPFDSRKFVSINYGSNELSEKTLIDKKLI